MSVGKRNNCFFLKTEAHERLISPTRVSSIAVTSACVISSSAIHLAVAHQIPIYFLDAFGQVAARLGGASFGNLAELRRQQVKFCDTIHATEWCIGLYEHKSQAQQDHLTQLAIRCPHQQDLIEETNALLCNETDELKHMKGLLADHADALRGKEGNMARHYWQVVAACVPAAFRFEVRTRQPAHDPFNALLNYLYGMLYGVVETALFSAGLDPYLGILHADQYGKPVLSYDLIEPFRPWIDQLITDQLFDNQIKESFFDANAEGIRLNRAGKRLIIPLFHAFINEKTEFQDAQATRQNHIYRFAGALRETIVRSQESQEVK